MMMWCVDTRNSVRRPQLSIFFSFFQSQVSQLFENCLRTLSHKHESVRFVKLHFADAEMEPAGVPALIAYRGGEKFAALVPIIEEMPADGDLDALTLEKVLQR